MQYKIVTKLSDNEQCVVVGVNESQQLITENIFTQSQLDFINTFINDGEISGATDSSLLLHQIPSATISRVLLVGLGKDETINCSKLAGTVTSALQATKISTVTFAVASEIVADLVQQFTYNSYKYQQTLSNTLPSVALENINFLNGDSAILATAIATATGVNFARELGNLPANLCTPSDLATYAKSLANDKILVEILDEATIKKLKMGSFLSVSAGSDEEAKLIVLEYKGHKTQQPYALVGKGVTFDTGGISLKPSPAMDEMKFDMCGAASVLGVFKALSQLNLPINVVGIIPSTENMPNGAATKPGDVVTSMSGQTIEILNTDAEGRLILCDALTYAAKFKPQQIIDIATLTGAVIVALGKNISGLMSNDDDLADELMAAGISSNDKVWRLPLADFDDSLEDRLDSNFADLANIGDSSGGGMSITAGHFLSKFVGDFKWAHLDIAGVAWKSGTKKGATGRPVRLLLQYLINKSQ